MFLTKKLNKKKAIFFLRYCIIGFISIFIELVIRKLLLNFNSPQIISSIFPLIIGISFAFTANISFNFKIPRYYYNRSFIYFSIISISSFVIQYFLSKIFIFENLNYEITRFLFSGIIFLIAYFFHIKYSFAKNKKVGVAIYLDDNENIDEIFSKVGFYPDYIHVDFVDETMNENVKKPNFEKLNQIKKIWPNHRIESHIMSKNPIKYIDRFSKYSDVIYFHYEINDEINKVNSLVKKLNIDSGLVLHASNKYFDLENIIKSYKEVLILCIKKPGESGQKFLDESTELINKINNLKIRDKFNLCVDGGLSQKNITKIECEKIVSASSVFKNVNPKKQITNLRKILNN
jgi:pentose-5-phosphate-3-epimerase/putative flippase GtrA